MEQTSHVLKHYKSISPIEKIVLTNFNKDLYDNIFYLYKDRLIYDADIVEFSDPKWERNTLKFCFDTYGYQYLFPIIHLVNNIGSMFDFTSSKLKYIIAPDIKTINKITRLPLY